MTNTEIKRLPYGISDFRYVRTNDFYYVDKTQYLPELESAGNFLYLVRPRRFGKSLFLSMLYSYYDCKQKDDFDLLFDGLWIHDNPTREKNKYLVLYLDFSQVGGELANISEHFDSYCGIKLDIFAQRYSDLFAPDFVQKMENTKSAADKLVLLTNSAKELGLPMYLIIDEYDNFTNNILNAIGLKEYKDITHGVGFYRDTFKKFKGNFERILMLGVSPVTLDDLTSGYNIALGITTNPRFNSVMGFSEPELREMIDYYRQTGAIAGETDDIVEEMKPWYNNNCFSHHCLNESKVFNSNMALYYLNSLIGFGYPPENMLDPNVRTDYKKLRRLIEIDGSNVERKKIIQQITNDGYIRAQLVESFPAEQIGETNNYVSLLFYYGMLTIAGKKGTDLLLAIPNHCIKDLYYSYLRDIYNNGDGLIDMRLFNESFNAMAEEGRPIDFISYVSRIFRESSSVRTLIDGERAVQTFLMAYLKLTPYYIVRVERELNHGYADFVLMPNPKYDNVEHAYVIELKYISKGDDNEAMRKTKILEAEEQLRRYAADEEIKAMPQQMHYIAIVFTGEEMAEWKELE